MAQEAPELGHAGRPGGSGKSQATAVWTLLGANAITALGIGFFLPILPLFVASRSSRGDASCFVSSGAMLSFFGRRDADAGDAGIFTGVFAPDEAVLVALLPVVPVVDGVAVPSAGGPVTTPPGGAPP